MKRYLVIAAFFLLMLAVTACTAGPNPNVNVATNSGYVAGFPDGLWHGIFLPFSLLISLFDSKVSIYEVHNNGIWYNLGFVMGAMAVFGGAGSARHRS